MRILQEGVEGAEQFSGGGDEGDFEGLARQAQTLVEALEDGVGLPRLVIFPRKRGLDCRGFR